MASKRHFFEEDFSCSICCGVFSDPVVLPCGHSGCGECVENYWKVKGSRECPLCRKVSANEPPLNLVLRNLCTTFLDYKRYLEERCEVHQKKLSVLCCDDGQLVCELCRDSEEHRNHTCRPICEVAEEKKVRMSVFINIEPVMFPCYCDVSRFGEFAVLDGHVPLHFNHPLMTSDALIRTLCVSRF